MKTFLVILMLIAGFCLFMVNQTAKMKRCESLGGTYNSRIVYGGDVSLCLSHDGRVLGQ